MRTLIFTTLTCVFALSAATAQVTLKKTPIQHTSAASGHEMYLGYCASCHGADGKGNGPATPALKMAPADLTMLATKNGGQFPAMRVSHSIREGGGIAAHGTSDMPVWGSLLPSVCASKDSNAETELRVSNLTNYIKSLQQK